MPAKDTDRYFVTERRGRTVVTMASYYRGSVYIAGRRPIMMMFFAVYSRMSQGVMSVWIVTPCGLLEVLRRFIGT